jgi:hypothetical protein
MFYSWKGSLCCAFEHDCTGHSTKVYQEGRRSEVIPFEHDCTGHSTKVYQEGCRNSVMLTGRDRITSVSPVLFIHDIILLCKWQLLLQG